MSVFWKKALAWCLILSLVFSADLFCGGAATYASEAGGNTGGEEEEEQDPLPEQKITVRVDNDEVEDGSPIRMVYGQEIDLEVETSGDGRLRYQVSDEPDNKTDDSVINLTSSGEIFAAESIQNDNESGQTPSDETENPGDESPSAGLTVKAVGIGTAKITLQADATEQYQVAERTITIEVSKADHQVNVSDVSMKFNREPFSLNAKWRTFDDGKRLSYYSEDEDVAVVNENGMVTVKKIGSAGIIVTAPETTHYRKTDFPVKITATTSLPTPVIRSAVDQDGSILLTWDRVPGVEGYLLERRIGSGSWTQIGNISGDSTVSFIDYGVQEGKNHVYRLRVYAYSGADISDYSKTLSARYLDYPAFQLTSGLKGNRVSWQASPGAAGYTIYRRTTSSQSWQAMTTASANSTLSWTDKKVSNGKIYYYTVQAYYGTCKSVVAPGKSIYYLQRPTFKKLKRKSATKIYVQWSKNTTADGYQLQYAKNSLFVGAKSVTLKGSRTVSRTLKKLTKNKTYYFRVRAYKTVNGTKKYSAWAYHSYVTKKKNASRSVLKKGKKTIELRKYSRQTLYQYDTLQGACSDGTYVYYIMLNKKNGKSKIIKMKLSSRKIVKISSPLKLDHGNDMTYNPDTKRLVVLHTDPNRKRAAVINKSTLKIVQEKDIAVPTKLMGASDKDLKGIKGFSSIAYSSKRKQYVLRERGDINMIICDRNLNPISYVVPDHLTKYTYQSMDATDEYIIYAQSYSSKKSGNILSIYTWDGEWISDINVKKGYELENVFHVGSQFYTGFYCSYYKTYYTKEKKTVKVKGKKKKVTVKIRHRKFMKDNYFYQLGKI